MSKIQEIEKIQNVIASPLELLKEIKKNPDPVTRRELLKRMGYTFGAVSTVGMLGVSDAHADTSIFM